jgi:hypothetical protein
MRASVEYRHPSGKQDKIGNLHDASDKGDLPFITLDEGQEVVARKLRFPGWPVGCLDAPGPLTYHPSTARGQSRRELILDFGRTSTC